jgi:hypothetical protein
MTRWKEVVWTEAWQVTGPLERPRADGDDAPPELYFAALRHAGEDVDAARFLASALPRFRAVQWLRQTIALLAMDADASTLAVVDEWLREPTDALRRQAFDVALPLFPDDPAKICATALLLSGGSLAPAGAPSLPPPKTGTGQIAAAGILQCAFASADPAMALGQALDLGDAIAATPGDIS